MHVSWGLSGKLVNVIATVLLGTAMSGLAVPQRGGAPFCLTRLAGQGRDDGGDRRDGFENLPSAISIRQPHRDDQSVVGWRPRVSPGWIAAIGEMPQFADRPGHEQKWRRTGLHRFCGRTGLRRPARPGPESSAHPDGRRRLMSSNPNGSVDLNTIPMSMIENVEIITGGASATYGSDAIAGVLNFQIAADLQRRRDQRDARRNNDAR